LLGFRLEIFLEAASGEPANAACASTTCAIPNASWLLAGGADLKTVMDRLGHTQIQTTQKYLHTLPDADEALAAFQRPRSGRRSE
jgi:integrase